MATTSPLVEMLTSFCAIVTGFQVHCRVGVLPCSISVAVYFMGHRLVTWDNLKKFPSIHWKENPFITLLLESDTENIA